MLKIRKLKSTDLIYILFLLCDIKFFYLFRLPPVFGGDTATNRILACVFVAITMTAVVIKNKGIVLKTWGKEIIFFELFIVIQMIFSIIRYPKISMGNVIYTMLPYGLLIFYLVAVNVKDVNYLQWTQITTYISIINSALLLFQVWYLRNVNYKFFLKIEQILRLYGRNTTQYRIFSVVEGFSRFSIILSIALILSDENKNKKSNLVNIILTFIAIVTIDRSRMYVVSMVSCSVLMIVYHYRLSLKRIKKNHLYVGVVCIAFGAIIFHKSLLPLIVSMMESWNSGSDGSGFARIAGYQYYLGVALTHPFLGNGLITPGLNSSYSEIVHARSIFGFNVNYDDVGLIGAMGKLGIFVAIWYLWCLYKFIRRIKFSSNKDFVIGASFNLLITMGTMFILDTQRIDCFVLTLIFSDLFEKINICDKNAERMGTPVIL